MRSPLHWNKQLWPLVTTLFILSAIISVGVGILRIWGPPILPLWYSRIIESSELATTTQLWAILAVTWGITLITLWFSRNTQLEHEKYIAVLSLYCGIIGQVLLLVALARLGILLL